MAPATNDEAYDVVSQIWTQDGRMTESQARATFAYLQPKGTQESISHRHSQMSFYQNSDSSSVDAQVARPL